jgi:hypothetical protein
LIPSAPMARRKTPVKIAVALVAVAALGFVFMRSVRSTRAEAYSVPRDSLRSSSLAVSEGSDPTAPVLMLRVSGSLPAALSRQMFSRLMESMTYPPAAEIPLVLQGEYEHELRGRTTAEALLAAARGAGLDAEPLQPRCLAHRRISTREGTRQIYFLLFDWPAFDRFRAQVGALAGGGGFDPQALSPVLIVGGTDQMFGTWMPLRADPKADCVAPIKVAEGSA